MYRKFTLSVICLMVGFGAFAVPLEDAHRFYLLGDTASSISVCLEAAGREGYSAEILYLLGLNYLKAGNYAKARVYFRKVAKSYKRSDYYEAALIKLADAFFLEGNFDKAEGLYEFVLKNFPETNYEALIYLRFAQIAFKEGRWRDKDKYVSKLKAEYPQAAERQLADILATRDNFFTVQVGAFSSEDNARSLLKALKAKYPAYLDRDKIGTSTIFKIKVGRYASRKEAQNVYYQLAKEGYPAIIYP